MSNAIFYSVLIFPVLSFICAIISAQKMQFSFEAGHFSVLKKSPAAFNINYINTIFTPPLPAVLIFNIESAVYSNERYLKHFMLTQRKSVDTLYLPSEYCGNYTVLFKKIIITDYTGLFSVSKKVDRKITYSVRPRIFDININNVPFAAEESAGRHVDPLNRDIRDYRNYTNDDSIKNIHWKLSAQKNELIVKNFDGVYPVSADIFIDSREKTGLDKIKEASLRDRMMEGAIAFINAFLKTDQSVRLFINGENYYIDPKAFTEAYALCENLMLASDELPLTQLKDSGKTELIILSHTYEKAFFESSFNTVLFLFLCDGLFYDGEEKIKNDNRTYLIHEDSDIRSAERGMQH